MNLTMITYLAVVNLTGKWKHEAHHICPEIAWEIGLLFRG